MAAALGGGARGRVKDASVLAPLFESEAGTQRRLAVERLHREAMKRQRVLESQRNLLAGGSGLVHRRFTNPCTDTVGLVSASSTSASSAVVGSSHQTDARAIIQRFMQLQGGAPESSRAGHDAMDISAPVIDQRTSRRKPRYPVRLARPAEYADAVQAAEAFRLGTPPVSQAGYPLRMHRFESLPAGSTLTLWFAKGAAAGALRGWGAASALVLQEAIGRAKATLDGVGEGTRVPSTSPLDAAESWRLMLRCGLAGRNTVDASLVNGSSKQDPGTRCLLQLLDCLLCLLSNLLFGLLNVKLDCLFG